MKWQACSGYNKWMKGLGADEHEQMKGVFLRQLLGELVSGSVVTHIDGAVLHQIAYDHEFVQISSLTGDRAVVKRTHGRSSTGRFQCAQIWYD